MTSPRIVLPVVAVALLAIGVGLWLGSPCTGFGCGGVNTHLTAVAFLGSDGWVTFNFTSYINTNQVIESVAAYENSGQTYLSTVTLSANNVLPAGGTLSLSIQFQGLTWQPGSRYMFWLQLSDGYRYGVYGCLNSC